MRARQLGRSQGSQGTRESKQQVESSSASCGPGPAGCRGSAALLLFLQKLRLCVAMAVGFGGGCFEAPAKAVTAPVGCKSWLAVAPAGAWLPRLPARSLWLQWMLRMLRVANRFLSWNLQCFHGL